MRLFFLPFIPGPIDYVCLVFVLSWFSYLSQHTFSFSVQALVSLCLIVLLWTGFDLCYRFYLCFIFITVPIYSIKLTFSTLVFEFLMFSFSCSSTFTEEIKVFTN